MRRAAWAGFAAVFLVFGCAEEEPAPISDAGGGPTRVIENFELNETRSGVLDWTLSADEALYYKSEGHTRLKYLELVYFESDGSLRSRLTADSGLIVEETGDMSAEGSVVLVTAELDTLLTDRVRYVHAQDIITGKGWVRISKPDRVLTGVGFTAKPDLTEYTVEDDVNIELIDRDGNVDLDQ